MELQAEGGGDLTINTSEGHVNFDATDPVASVVLSLGTATVPVKNWVYILQSNNTLTVSAVSFPDVEFAPIATVVIQDAATVASSGPLAVQAWTDHIKDANDQGHLTDIHDWIRGQHATWFSGIAPTLTFDTVPEPDTVIHTSTAGVVAQLHKHDVPAFTGTPTIRVVNDNTTPYKPITDLNQLDAIADGTPFSNNDYFAVTIFVVASEKTADSKTFLLLPSGVYGNSTALELDSSMFANTSIPALYKGSAVLVVQYLLRYQTIGSGTFTLVAEIDLRGQPPGTSTGGGAGGGSSLAVEEDDGTPSIQDVNTIIVDNGTLADEGGGIARLNNSGTPGGSDTQVQFNDSGVFAGDAGFTYDAVLDALYAAGWVYSLRFRLMDGDTNHIDFLSPALSADWILTWPANDGDSGQVLRTDGAGVTTWVTAAGGGDMLQATYDTDTNNIVDITEGVPHVTSGDVVVLEGQVIQKSHEDAWAVNGGGVGEVQGEALMSMLDTWSFNLALPKSLFYTDTKWYITTLDDKSPNGMVIVEMTCQCDADPTTEIDATLQYATGGDFIGLTGATLIIAIDSTNGTFSEDTNANFNGGNPIPAGAVLYVLIDAAPDVLTTQYGCTVTSYNPED